MTIVIITTMKVLSVCLALCGLLTLSEAHPLNFTEPASLSMYSPCFRQQKKCSGLIGSYCPQCDEYGYFLRQQCWASTGYCWCVNPYSGDEIPNTRTPPGTPPVDCSMINGCPSGWEKFGDGCYKFVDSKKSWTEAELYCQFDRANLASIHSSVENHFIQYLTRGSGTSFPNTWIGGFYFMNTHVWMWIDGSQFNYADWANDTVSKSSDNCLLMNYGLGMKWANHSCVDSFPFVCARKL